MPLSDVKVKIDLLKAAGSLGFGFPLILQENAQTEIPYTECEGLSEISAAGFAADSDVYKAATLMLAQNNAPSTVAVCASSGNAAIFLSSEKNTGKEWRQLMVIPGTATKAVYTKTTDVTVDESKTYYTGSNGTYTAVESPDDENISEYYEKTTPAAPNNSSLAEIMQSVEALDGKMFFTSLETNDTTELTVNGIDRTVLFYCDKTDTAKYPEAALIGATAGLDPGSFTYKNLILSGIAPQELTSAQVKAIHEKGGITFVEKAGDGVTTEGKTAGGEYIDIIDCKDYIIQQFTYKTQKALNDTLKVPYTDSGIARLESAGLDVLKTAYNNGMIAENSDGTPAYSVSYAARSECAAGDISSRVYCKGKFSFTLSGAVHNVEITGEITA